MARSFSNAKIVSALILDGFSNASTRRGYAVAAGNATRGVGSYSAKMGTKSGEEKVGSTNNINNKVSWVPDPVTGYYKPENIKEIDVADLRATLLGKKFFN